MAELGLFITPTEFIGVIRKFVERRDLALRLRTGDQPRKPHDDAEFYGLLMQPWQGVQFYLAPPPTSGTNFIPGVTGPRSLGWVAVKPGHVLITGDGEVLTMSSLIAEDRQGLPFQPARWLRCLKQDLAKAEPPMRFGVIGTNVKFGGEDVYASIGYSEEANARREGGTRWKQYVDDNGEFRPSV